MPYYRLISLEKNFKFHINMQMVESLHVMDAGKIVEEVVAGCEELAVLEAVTFARNPTLLKIVKDVALSYKQFREKLPIIQILRNPDLRERHWASIK